MAKYRFGMVLSGGGARGIAHLGVLKALEEHGIFPEIVSGTSAGSIIGGFYCGGMRPDEIYKILKETEYLKVLRPGFGSAGIIANKSMAKVLERYLPKKTFEELVLPLVVCATNLRTGQSQYFRSGDLIKPIKASSAIPILVTPVEIGGEMYVDGGVLNNFPLDPIQEDCMVFLGSTVNPIQTETIPNSMRSVAERTFILSIRANSAAREAKTDWLVEPNGLHKYGVLEVKKAEDIFKLGYESALEKMGKSDPLKILDLKMKGIQEAFIS